MEKEQNRPVINVYSDESRHFSDNQYMVIGSIWCDASAVKQFAGKIQMIRNKHNIPRKDEIKWAKISSSRKEFYFDLVKLFFSDDSVNYRAIIIHKAMLNHEKFNQTADDFYYKAQYYMIKNIVIRNCADYRIYLDYKDAYSPAKCKELSGYLKRTFDLSCSNFFCQPIRSYESTLLQMADLITGAIAASNNGGNKVQAKNEVAALIEEYAGQRLIDKTDRRVEKFNLFRWHDGE